MSSETWAASGGVDPARLARGGSAALGEARRQIEICNACRYCEGFCSVFPAMTRQAAFADGDLTHLANLCHNCRGCYYACQYAPPHAFALNLPAALAEVRQDSWERFAWPQPIARRFHADGVALAALLVAALAFILAAMAALKPAAGAGFYAYLSHGAMAAIFLPAFLLPLAAVGVALGRQWRETGGERLTLADLASALAQAATMRQLSGGHGEGCNFELEDRFSNRRRLFHQLLMWGFLLCFASTASGTIMHYLLAWPAPYGFWTPPKLLGAPGGLMMVAGSLGLLWLKTKADPTLGAARVFGGETAFTLLLGFVAASGLALYAATGSGLVAPLLAAHLASVLALFLLTPYSKMVHGFHRLLALVVEEAKRRRAPAGGQDAA